MNVKECKQCGLTKPIEQFRQYYGGRQGTYTMCRSCERINSRAKYLERKSARTVAEEDELNKIYQLYDAQSACGYQPPRRENGRQEAVVENLDSLIQVYTERANLPRKQLSTLDTNGTPAELQQWLTCKLTNDPDYYLDGVYEALKTKYKPVERIDQDTLLPVYDETYADILEAILSRFNTYEDTYYNS